MLFNDDYYIYSNIDRDNISKASVYIFYGGHLHLILMKE